MDRRRFLLTATGTALGLATLPFSGQLFASPASSPRFLLVFLRGGYDCNHLLVPYSSDFYYDSRPTLAIAKPDNQNKNSAIALDSNWGLTPALRESILPIWQRKQAAFIPFAGTDDLSRSHFETQDNIERGEPSNAKNPARSGFLARLSEHLTKAPAIAFTNNLPLSLQGSTKDIPNISLRRPPSSRFDARQSSILSEMYQGTSLEAATSSGLALPKAVSKDLKNEMVQSGRGAGSTNDFATETRRIASLMRDQYRIGFVDVGGWDTHIGQGNIDGGLSKNLRNLGEGLAAYADALGSEWKNTVVVVVSEFGRTFRENGDKGTDHGHGTVYWALGGGVHGGQILGEQVSVQASNLLQNRDYPVINNYRDILAGLFGRMWGLSQSQLQTIFPMSKPRNIGII